MKIAEEKVYPALKKQLLAGACFEQELQSKAGPSAPRASINFGGSRGMCFAEASGKVLEKTRRLFKWESLLL